MYEREVGHRWTLLQQGSVLLYASSKQQGRMQAQLQQLMRQPGCAAHLSTLNCTSEPRPMAWLLSRVLRHS